MHSAKSVSVQLRMEDIAVAGGGIQPTAIESTNVSQVNELSNELEIWLNSSTPEERADFIREMEKSMINEPSSMPEEQFLVNPSPFMPEEQPFYEQEDNVQGTRPVHNNWGQSPDQVVTTSGGQFEPDIDLNSVMELGQSSSTIYPRTSPALVADLYLQQVNPIEVVEEMFAPDCGEDLSRVKFEQVVDQQQYTPAGYYDRRTQEWAMNSGNYGPRPAKVRPMHSLETASEGMSDPDDDQLIQDEEQSNSARSIRLGGRRFSSLEKKERRREQNRRAATKCRNRKKAAFETFREECERVKLENKRYRAQMQTLMARVADLTRIIEFHQRKCVIKCGA